MEKLEEDASSQKTKNVISIRTVHWGKTSHKAELFIRYVSGKSSAGAEKILLQRSNSKRRALCKESNDFNRLQYATDCRNLKNHINLKLGMTIGLMMQMTFFMLMPCLKKMKKDGAGEFKHKEVISEEDI